MSPLQPIDLKKVDQKRFESNDLRVVATLVRSLTGPQRLGPDGATFDNRV